MTNKLKNTANDYYGRMGGFIANDGKEKQLFDLLCKASTLMKGADGCYQYIVGKNIDDEKIIWVCEIWESADYHKKSLALNGVRELIAQAMPMIKSTIPVGAELEIFKGSISNE